MFAFLYMYLRTVNFGLAMFKSLAVQNLEPKQVYRERLVNLHRRRKLNKWKLTLVSSIKLNNNYYTNKLVFYKEASNHLVVVFRRVL